MSAEDIAGDVSGGRAADPDHVVAPLFPASVRDRFEIFSYRNAATILRYNFPQQWDDLISALERFQITQRMIREPGGSKSQIAYYVDRLFDDNWGEARISADLHVRLTDPKKQDVVLNSYIRRGYLDGHRIDFVNGRVALDLEWNSKDQTYDRDLYAFSAFYEAGAIDLGVLITRGSSMDNDFFRSLGNVLKKDGTDGSEPVHKKYGASTTWMGKLLYRLDAGRNGGCPVIAIGITPACVVDAS